MCRGNVNVRKRRTTGCFFITLIIKKEKYCCATCNNANAKYYYFLFILSLLFDTLLLFIIIALLDSSCSINNCCFVVSRLIIGTLVNNPNSLSPPRSLGKGNTVAPLKHPNVNRILQMTPLEAFVVILSTGLFVGIVVSNYHFVSRIYRCIFTWVCGVPNI